MPVWGPTLRALDASDARVTVRLQNLVAFVESIQQPSPGGQRGDSDAAGRRRRDLPILLRAVPRHGRWRRRRDGRSAAAGAAEPHRPSRRRNGGVFPAERVRQVIEGAGPAAHGDRDMPVWGEVFKRLRVGGASAQDRIDAVVRYLQEIQERPAE